MSERWHAVPGWPYEASDRGRVRSVDRVLGDGRFCAGVILHPTADRDGYLYVALSDGGRRQWVHVARLVLLAHVGMPPTARHEALHGNGRRRDNRLRNLRWGTRAENRADRDNHERERRDRAARRVARASGSGVTEVNGRETDEIGGAASCPTRVASATGESCRSEP